MYAPTPMSRDEMRSLKAKKDEEIRLQRVNIIVSTIYERAINQAKTTSDTRFNYEVPIHPSPSRHERENITFHNDNMAEILRNLKILFPLCSIDFKSITMAKGHDGKDYDVTDLDEKALAFVRDSKTKSCITIDWS